MKHSIYKLDEDELHGPTVVPLKQFLPTHLEINSPIYWWDIYYRDFIV